MSELTLVYSEMEDAAGYAKIVANKCQDYIDELDKKWSQKWKSTPSSPLSTKNARTESADYYVNMKKQQLAEKKKHYKSFADKMDDLIEDAKVADKKVAKSVNDSQKTFLKSHKNLSGDGWTAFFASISVDIPVIGWVIDAAGGLAEGFSDLCNNIRYWYEVDGGKKIVDTALAIGEIVLGVCGLVLAIITFPVSGFFAAVVAVAGLISAVIAMADGITNLVYQLKANKQSDPAWAQYYGGIDSTADFLREKTFKGDWKWFNKWSNGIATGIEVTNLICSVISIADTVGNLYKRSGLKKLFSSKSVKMVDGKPVTKYKFDFTKFKNTITSKSGRASITKSLKYSWKGMLFGDSDGIEGWKKSWKRAFTSKFTYGKDVKTVTKVLDRVEKITKVFKGDFSKVMTTVNTVKSFGNLITYQDWSGKDVYSAVKNIYSVTIPKGDIVGVTIDSVDFVMDKNDFTKNQGELEKKSSKFTYTVDVEKLNEDIAEMQMKLKRLSKVI